MPNLNRVMLMGNMTRDPELRYLPSNTAVVNFGIAVNRQWRSQEGEQREETTFVECTAFGRTGEVINQYLKKGRPIYVEGRLRLEQWQDKQTGGNRSKLSVVADNFQFLDTRASAGDSADYGSPKPTYDSGRGPAPSPDKSPLPGTPDSPAAAPSATVAPPNAETHQPVDESDIPF